MTTRACLRLLLLAALLLAPLGRIGMAQAMAAPTGASVMAGHCAELPAGPPAHHQGDHPQKAPAQDHEGMTVDCMIACAAMAAAPDSFVAPAPDMVALPLVSFVPGLTGIQPEADPPPPRIS